MLARNHHRVAPQWGHSEGVGVSSMASSGHTLRGDQRCDLTPEPRLAPAGVSCSCTGSVCLGAPSSPLAQ